MSEERTSHPNVQSFNYMDGHLSAKQVISIVCALLAAAAAIFGGTIAIVKNGVGLEYTVNSLKDDVSHCAKKTDIEAFRASIETAANASAAERAKFYVTHSDMDCDLSTKNKKHVRCKLIFPVPEE